MQKEGQQPYRDAIENTDMTSSPLMQLNSARVCTYIVKMHM